VDPTPYTWAGLQSPLYPRYSTHARGTSWIGSLVANKHDGSGLVYMRNRYLNPQTGQFTQTDPIGLAGGLNLYGYAGGDPINFSDPFGLRAQACCTREDLADIGVGLIPVVGNLHDAHTAIRGKNIVTGDDASSGDRLFAAAGVVLPVSGGAIKAGGRVVREAAERLANRLGRNSVSIGTVDGVRRVDLVGRPHGGVETPHVHTYSRHTNPETGQTSVTRDSRLPTSATMQDIRQARRVAGSPES
jgi:RHS repeat-associated protein